MKSSNAASKKDFSVKEAALKVGYKHTGHFSKIFSNRFGITPSYYKKQLKS
ncbi:helix-turn-helix domain-containing protein [Halarcobacter anaerophilus]|uniref:helix-turn-helix domain-containing protein n=1 Tax=Halarcobacter anaerophilus TaxID=877500 RepID=UPI0018E39B15